MQLSQKKFDIFSVGAAGLICIEDSIWVKAAGSICCGAIELWSNIIRLILAR